MPVNLNQNIFQTLTKSNHSSNVKDNFQSENALNINDKDILVNQEISLDDFDGGAINGKGDFTEIFTDAFIMVTTSSADTDEMEFISASDGNKFPHSTDNRISLLADNEANGHYIDEKKGELPIDVNLVAVNSNQLNSSIQIDVDLVAVNSNQVNSLIQHKPASVLHTVSEALALKSSVFSERDPDLTQGNIIGDPLVADKAGVGSPSELSHDGKGEQQETTKFLKVKPLLLNEPGAKLKQDQMIDKQWLINKTGRNELLELNFDNDFNPILKKGLQLNKTDLFDLDNLLSSSNLTNKYRASEFIVASQTPSSFRLNQPEGNFSVSSFVRVDYLNEPLTTLKNPISMEFSQGLSLKQNFTPNLAMRIQWMFNQSLSSATIILDPPEMGPLIIKIQHHNGETNIMFQVAQAGTKEMLEDNLSRLKEMLEQQGIKLGEAVVEQQKQQQQKNSKDTFLAGKESDIKTEDELHEQQELVTLKTEQLVDVYS